MNGIIALLAIIALLLGVGALLGLVRRELFSFRWLLAAAGLVLLNDALLTRAYGRLPDLIGGEYNWQGKLLALAATLAIAALPAFGWRRSGITLAQRPGSLRPALLVAAGYALFLLALALLFPNDPLTPEDVPFQLTLPGLEEEAFYRGILLLALDQAFRGRVRLFGVDWGWGALLSSALFGLAHAFNYGAHGFGFDPLFFALTAGPSLVGVWFRYRTGSLLLPVVLHNFGNTLALFV